jgi:hypothetical protein
MIGFPTEVLRELTQVERDERKLTYRAVRKTIIDMNRAEIQASMEGAAWEEFQQELLVQWRRLYDRALHETANFDRIAADGLLWTGIAVIRMTVPDEWANLGVMEEEVEQLNLYKVMLSVKIRDYFDNTGNRFFHPEEEEGIRAIFDEAFDPELGEEIDDISWILDNWEIEEDDSSFSVEELATGRENRRIAILALYPEVPREFLAADDQECPICGEEYGAEHDDKDTCQPRVSTCCPPAKIGSACLLQWFVASSHDTCPICRSDLTTRMDEVTCNKAL